MLDLVVRGGTVIDGTGRPGFRADVGVAGDTIAAVGGDGLEAAVTLDASGLVVTPGFVDLHSHSDYTLLLNRPAESAIRQGVTTELVGNCGMSCAPLADPAHLALVLADHIPGVEPRWRSFGQWLDALADGGVSVNVAALVGHGALRLAVMGPAPRPASAAETEAMARGLEAGLDEGAFGLSSGLEYPAGRPATSAELAALAAVVGRRGGLYATHIRNRDYHYLDAVQEALDTGTAGGVRLQVSHVSPRWGVRDGAAEEALQRIERARGAG